MSYTRDVTGGSVVSERNRENETETEVTDLARLINAEDRNLLKHLQNRYNAGKIYTYIGDVLLAANPYNDVNIYGKEQHPLYTNLVSRDSRDPHVFWVADNAQQRMRDTGRNQCILFMGESGSGQTEQCKFAIQHLAYLCETEYEGLEEKIYQVGPLLEAYGNAQTGLNDNSSRFGKLLEFYYDRDAKLCGAKVHQYFFEKWRVLDQTRPEERNFHIFYYMFAGLSKGQLGKYYLESPDLHRVLRPRQHLATVYKDSEDVDFHKDMFERHINLLRSLGFSNLDIGRVFQVLAAVLHLSDISFGISEAQTEMTRGEVYIENAFPLKAASELLSLNQKVFQNALLSSTAFRRGYRFNTKPTLSQANSGRDALVKAVYSRLVSWIIHQINSRMRPGSANSGRCVSVFDTTGFESFPDNNGFEQLHVNVTSERLHQHFIETQLVREQGEYKLQRLQWNNIDYDTNRDLTDMMLAPSSGLFALLDDECQADRATDASFVERLVFKYNGSPFLSQGFSNINCFSVNHFAKKVDYNAVGFIDKNREKLSDIVVECLSRSEDDLVRSLFSVNISNAGQPLWGEPNNEAATVDASTSGSTYRNSLAGLMTKLNASDPHFVVCLKPNTDKAASLWREDTMMDQIRHFDLVDLVEMKRNGYATRFTFEDFVNRYRNFFFMRSDTVAPTAVNCERILMHQNLTGYAIGTSKVFLKADDLRLLNGEVVRESLPAASNEDKDILVERMISTSQHHQGSRQTDTGSERHLSQHSTMPSSGHTSRHDSRATSVIMGYVEGEPTDPVRLRDAPSRRGSASLPRTSSVTGPATGSISMNPAGVVSASRSISHDGRRTMSTGENQGIWFTGSSQNRSRGENNSVSNSNAARSASNTNRSTSVTNGSQRQGSFSTGQNGSIPGAPPSYQQIREADSMRQSKTDGSSVVGSARDEETTEAEFDAWDVFKITDMKKKKSKRKLSLFVMRFLRVLTVVACMVLLLLSVIGSKASLFILANAIRHEAYNNHPAYRDFWILLILCSISIPYAWTFIKCLFRSMFGRKEWPSFGNLLWCLGVESVHGIGMVLFVIRVLPCLDMIRGLLLMTCTLSVPSVLKLLLSHRSENTTKKVCSIIWDILTMLMQWSVFAVIATITPTCGPDDKSSGKIEIISAANFVWEIPLSVFLMSFIWWENFADNNFTCGAFEIPLREYRQKLRYVRVKTYLFASIWKIGVMFGFTILIHPDFKESIVAIFTQNMPTGNGPNYLNNWTIYIPFLVHAVASPLSFHFGCTAIKLMMQRVSFAFPLVLVTPLMLTGLLCINMFVPEYLSKPFAGHPMFYWRMPDDWRSEAFLFHLMIGVGVWWLSQMILARHIWFPQNMRMAFTDRIMIVPWHCAGLLEQSLLFNRRRNDREVFIWDDLDDNMSEDMVETGEREKKMAAKSKGITPKVYACGTMWHENEEEMLQLLTSLFRMDNDQSARRLAQENFGITDPDYYEFEAHLFVDDAMELNDKEDIVPNAFVRQLVSIIERAASNVHEVGIRLGAPTKINTPYGTRFIWEMPGGNQLIAHMKDKRKIRNRKRWSQCMYMYYLLGYRIMGVRGDQNDSNSSLFSAEKLFKMNKHQHYVKSDIFKGVSERTLLEAENTYILTLDGDVDFKPEAVQLLLDRMKKNHKVGACCGRIHPIGGGPMVWYQQFEYAIGHWLQKAAEHMFGCVLCSPGCFSVFRGSALMDDNVVRAYATKATEARHYVQYDQGEDRWLCTLILKQGWRVEYVAAADAQTYAPSAFKEFYNQRRRWVPSTLANCMELIQSWNMCVNNNDNISHLYMLYQLLYLVSTILGPSTIIIMVAGAINSVFQVSVPLSYLGALLPVILFIIFCYTTAPNTQITVAFIMSIMYSLIMIAVVISIMIQAAQDSILFPNALFLITIGTIFVLSAILHPTELLNLFPGIIYFVAIPSGYLLLIVYALCNLNVVSWGTRELPKGEQDQQKLVQQQQGGGTNADNLKRFLTLPEDENAWCGLKKMCRCCDPRPNTVNRQMMAHILLSLDRMETGPGPAQALTWAPGKTNDGEAVVPGEEMGSDKKEGELGSVSNGQEMPKWWQEPMFRAGPVGYLEPREEQFWTRLLDRYMYPIIMNDMEQRRANKELAQLRNNSNVAFFLVNLLWIAIIFMLQLVQADLREATFIIIPRPGMKPLLMEPLGLTFLTFFAIILFLQFVAMLLHRYGTLLHILASTQLRGTRNIKYSLHKDDDDASSIDVRQYIDLARNLQHIDHADTHDAISTTKHDDDDLGSMDTHRQRRMRLRRTEYTHTAEVFNQRFGQFRRRVERQGGNVNEAVEQLLHGRQPVSRRFIPSGNTLRQRRPVRAETQSQINGYSRYNDRIDTASSRQSTVRGTSSVRSFQTLQESSRRSSRTFQASSIRSVSTLQPTESLRSSQTQSRNSTVGSRRTSQSLLIHSSSSSSGQDNPAFFQRSISNASSHVSYGSSSVPINVIQA